ncbi:MAG: glycosyltransferase [Salinarimonas sp.]
MAVSGISGLLQGGDQAGSRATAASADRPYFDPVFSGWRKAVNLAGIAIWLAALAYFWIWWFQPGHIHTPGRWILVTFILAWITLIPAYYVAFVSRARVCAARAQDLPDTPRVACVVTKAPSEPFAIVRRTLEGAISQSLPDARFEYDVWLADEDPDAETLAWCAQHGVQVSCRKGIAEYHRPEWPRRTRCKEGNLAYFYDTYGYDTYDFVAQFDADHIPQPDYLTYALAPFVDPAVGYVSAPSICDTNAAQSWSARGRLYAEAGMHGLLQCGANGGLAPLCIGSHYTVRTRALREIGGLGPELAEDHSTTLFFNAHGWRGVHAVDAIANGAGPESFADLAVQEFQWSRSLVTLLLEWSPNLIPKMDSRRRIQFAFSQLWYPMFSSIMALAIVLPIFALMTGEHFVNVTYVDYFVHMLPLAVIWIVLAFWWRATRLFRPAQAPIFSWEGVAFLFLRWPWALIGSLAAAYDHLRGRAAEFRVTPKGSEKADHLPLRVVMPYCVIVLVSGWTAFAVTDPGSAAGFYVFSLFNGATYAGLTLLVLWRHARENGLSFLPRSLAGLVLAACLVAMLAGLIAGAQRNGTRGLHAISLGITAFTITETRFTPSGAGRETEPSIHFNPRWRGFRGE